jgi:C-terminal processing protease CtpA/Prc
VDRATFVLQLQDGSTKRIEFSPIGSSAKPNLLRAPDWSKLKLPISMTPHSTKYWFEYDEPNRAIYVRYDSCVDDPKYPFAQFSKELMSAIDSKKPTKVIFDLRNNSGGDSRVAEPLINALRDNKTVNEKGKLFVLIGRATFSSAQMNAQQFRDRTHATLVGEPTGQKPNAFGEIKNFTLPNSGLIVQYSTKQFRQSEKDEPSMIPDEMVEPTSEEFFGGRDVVLEKVLAPLPGREGRGEG